MSLVLTLLLAASAGESPPIEPTTERLDAMPFEFVGTWNASPEACAVRGDTVLEITPSTLTFHESHGLIVAIVRRDAEVVVIVELSGEGETWLVAHHFRKGDDDDSLLQVDGPYDAEPLTRVRCP